MYGEEVKYRGYSYKVVQDEDPYSPRDNDNLGIMAFSHKKYKLGDDTNIPFDKFTSWREVEEYIEKTLKGILISPVYMLDHSGLYISLTDPNDRWDSGRIGFIYTTAKRVREMNNAKRMSPAMVIKADEILKAEVETYSAFVSGSVYMVFIYDENGDDVECQDGFYEVEFAEQSAKELIDYCLDKLPALDKK
jgi:hypothetical protein